MALIIERINRSNHALALAKFSDAVVNVGRGFNQSLIVDDPFVDAQHLQLSIDELTHGILCIDRGSKNGVFIEPAVGKKYRVQGKAQLTSGDVVVIGRTRLRVCHSAHHVKEAEALTFAHRCVYVVSAWPFVVLMALLLASLSIAESYLALPVDAALKRYALESLYAVAAVFFYGVAWASVGRALRGDGRLITQVLIAGVGASVLSALGFAVPWFAYHLPAEEVWFIANKLLMAGVFFVAVLVSVGMATRLSRLGRIATALLVPGAIALNLVITYVDSNEAGSSVPYQRVLVAPAVNIRPTIESNVFIDEAKDLYKDVDRTLEKD